MAEIPLYYVRFLKPPPEEYVIGQHFTIVWAVESDLGNCAYWESLPIICCLQGCPQLGLRVLDVKKKKQTITTTNPLSRDITVTYDPYQGGGTVTRLVIEQLPGKPLPLGAKENIQFGMFLAPSARSSTTGHSVWQNAYISSSSIWVIPIWSAPIHTTVAKQRHFDTLSGDQAERVLRVNEKRIVRIREDTVQSIARHVWDCGLSMCQFLKEHKNELNFKVLIELGSGTGLVGIYAAEVLRPNKVYLTDLADALEIMQQNVDLMKTKDIVSVRELPWGGVRQEEYKDADLVLLTDVLYNQSSHDVLLDTLDWLLDNKNSRALLSYKERSPEERVFFEKVKQRQWVIERIMPADSIFEFYWLYK
ncbi:unnamed protein product [Rhizopus microsporus]